MSNSVNPYIISPEQWERDRKAKKQPAVEKKSKANKNNRSRWQILNDFWDFTAKSLTPCEVLVWGILFREVKPDGLAKIGYSPIAQRAGRSRRAVYDAVHSLAEKGLITIVSQGNNIKGVSVYRIQSLMKET